MHIHTRIRLIALTEDSDSPCRFLCMRMCVWIYGVREPGSRTCMHEPVNDNLSGYIGLYWFVFCSILFHKSVMAIQTPFKFTVFVLTGEHGTHTYKSPYRQGAIRAHE